MSASLGEARTPGMGRQARRLDRLTLGDRQENRTLRLRCDLPPSVPEGARLAAVSRLSIALSKWTRHFDALHQGAVTLRRSVRVPPKSCIVLLYGH